MRFSRLLLFLGLLAAAGLTAAAVTSPKQQFGFDIGDDYCLVNYRQLAAYWQKLDAESDRLKVFDIGRTAEGRTMLLAVITSPRNQTRLARYKAISRRLGLAEGLTEAEGRRLAAEGRSVVWIDGGLHATEILGSQQLIELVWQMTSRNDPETLRFLDDVILLACCPNPDGLDLVADWYLREKDPQKRSMAGLPRLYQKYIGHDNNRDFYMVTQPETEAVARVFYQEWFPQIVYNHHQSGPAGTVLFAPPFRNPFNYDFDPLVPVGIDLVASAMHNRFIAENKPGATMRSGARYSTWWSGGLRSTSYFHNMIGILTETIGNPTPLDIPFLPQKLLPSTDLPYPITPQKWHFRQSIDYLMTADRAVLDTASKYRQELLFRRYLMGRNSIERGRRDFWTLQPRDVAAVQDLIDKDKAAAPAGRFRGYPLKYFEAFRDPAKRDPRGYILPSDQPDFSTAVKFANTLIKNGVTVLRATRAFEVAGRNYPAGSLAVKCDQAFRPHILSQFEPQNHPHDFEYPGGPPLPPYDNAGWTLAFQMAVQFDRILEGFDGPFEIIKGLFSPPPAQVTGAENAAGYLLSHRPNDAALAVNRLLAKGEEVFWLKQPLSVGGKTFEAGTIYIEAGAATRPALERLAAEKGLEFFGLERRPAGEAFRLRPVRIGLWDSYGGSMPSGWIRWLLEQFEFPARQIYVPELEAGALGETCDVLILVGGAIPQPRDGRESPEEAFENVPQEYKHMLGQVTPEKTIPQLLKFMEEGGTVLAIGGSTALASYASLPLANALTEKLPDGSEKPLSRDKYYIPGSILQVRVDNSNPLAYGLPDKADVFFNNSPTFRMLPQAALKDLESVAWFEGKEPLRSGWAWGQGYLEGGVAVLSAPYGIGKLYLFGPEITFRGQPHGTFKFLFNGIYLGAALDIILN
jgi:hypothetical protein